MSRRLLAVRAHPDDGTFLMGGTLALLAKRGWRAFLLTATDGERARRGPYENDSLSTEAFGALRREELEAACRTLGVRALPGVGCPDGVSGHPDHVAVGRVTRAAVKDYRASAQPPGPHPELVFVRASGSLPECCLRSTSGPEPTETLRVGVAATAARKLQAITAYQSQEHLQARDAAHRTRMLEWPERFHRVAWAGIAETDAARAVKRRVRRRPSLKAEIPA